MASPASLPELLSSAVRWQFIHVTIQVVGLPDKTVAESREQVQAALLQACRCAFEEGDGEPGAGPSAQGKAALYNLPIALGLVAARLIGHTISEYSPPDIREF